MGKAIKLPQYIIRELQKANDYANKSRNCVEEFEKWVLKNVDEDFSFDVLRATEYGEFDESSKNQTEALTELEYGNGVDVYDIEQAINAWINRKTGVPNA